MPRLVLLALLAPLLMAQTQFYPVAPCRLVDTRGAAAGFVGVTPFNGPAIAPGSTISIPVLAPSQASTTAPTPCGPIPSTATAYWLNLTLVPAGATATAAGGQVDYLTVWPAGAAQPTVSSLDDPEGLILSNGAVIAAGAPFGGLSLYNAGPSATDVVIDLNGYFLPVETCITDDPGVAETGAAAFTLSFIPNPPTSLKVYVNGVRHKAGIDYALSGNLVTFAVASAPQVGDNLIFDYCY